MAKRSRNRPIKNSYFRALRSCTNNFVDMDYSDFWRVFHRGHTLLDSEMPNLFSTINRKLLLQNS